MTPHYSPATGLLAGATPLVIIPCGSLKANHPAAAGDLYIGHYHRSCRRAADALTPPGRILVLSALHGLLRLDEVIAPPYELRVGEPGSVTAAQLRAQGRQLSVDRERTVIVLAGRAYTEAARAIWPDALTPLADAGGMGHQRAVLATIAASAALPRLRTGP